MKFKERIKKEKITLPLMLKGYSRTMANVWYGKVRYDLKSKKRKYGTELLDYWHKKGYLSSSIERYNLVNVGETDYISDFQYTYLKPFNNSFSKWLQDIITTRRVLRDYDEHIRNVYFSTIRREGKTLLLKAGADYCCTVEDVMDLLREKGSLELRPAFWASKGRRHLLTLETIEKTDEETGEVTREEILRSNGVKASERWLRGAIGKLTSNYIIADSVSISYPFFEEAQMDHSVKFWIANNAGPEPQILCAVMNLYYNEGKKRVRAERLIDLESGTFEFNDEIIDIPDWDAIKEELCKVSASISQINYYTTSIALKKDEPFQFLHFSVDPVLPSMAFNQELNEYLLNSFNKRFRKRSLKDRFSGLREKRLIKQAKKHARKGFRPYMYKLWRDTVRSDFWHTKGVSLSKKIWAWKHGFFSWHTYQYGITKTNFMSFLSDYDYYWLNRINNDYQKWLNDKTTYRLIMDPFKEYLPKYYFSIFKRDGQPQIKKMWDCPEGISEGFDGLLEMLRSEGKLALKASAGTHGDGFYCLAYENGQYLANGEPCDEKGLEKIINELGSFYVVTEYLVMHEQLRKIYDKSVNTVRMMVINPHGYDPKIMQTYMRIGSSKTGFTDNVGYGGICVFVNKETGELYQPETIKDHVFYPCPEHPDTGTPIAGILPHWDLVCEKVLEMSRYLCELEYLGYDIAITDAGFCVLEINIHQDLHKVATYDEEIMDFFRRKMKIKRGLYKAD